MMKRRMKSAYSLLRRQQKVAELPIHLQVETTNACNLRCATCHRDLLYPRPKAMKFENFRKIFDEVQPENINVSGLGEPFLNPEIFEMIKYSKRRGALVNCASNFTLVGNKIDRIIESGIDQIKVSIDASDPETFHKIRGKDLYSALCENIGRLNKAKRKKNTDKPALRFNYALQKDNIDQLTDTVKLAADLNVQGIYVQYLEYFDREDRKDALVGNLSKQKLKSIFFQADRIARERGILSNINIWLRDFDLLYNKMLPEDKFVPNQKKCYFPWFSSWIDADGSVRPCPIIPWQREEGHMGNVFREKFRDIWNNDRYQELRGKLAQGERPFAPCKTCIPQSLANIFQLQSKLLPGKK